MLLKILYIVLLILSLQTAGGNLIAQPQIEWHRTYNSPANGDDRAASIAIDSSGNIIACGSDGEGGYRIIKYTNNGQQLWTARYFETIGFPLVAKKVAVDASNNIYVTGYNESIVTVKYNLLGILQWVRKYKGNGSFLSEPHDMEIDRNGFIYVTGESSVQNTFFDFVTIKYNSNGDSLWTRTYNGIGNGIDRSQALEVDSIGNVYVTGDSESLHDTAYYPDITTIKYDTFGNILWVNRYIFSNFNSSYCNDMTKDDYDNLYLSGFSLDSNNYEDILTIKYNSNGVFLWSKIFNGKANSSDRGLKIIVDYENNVIVGGVCVTDTTGGDFCLIKYNLNGSLIWSRTINGYLDDYMQALVKDDFSNYYFTGNFFDVQYDKDGNIKWFQPSIVNSKYYNGKSILIDSNTNLYLLGDYYNGIKQIDLITVKYSQPIGIQPISNEIPRQYSLTQNYPNPFNPNTIIEFQLPVKSKIEIIVYDVLGREMEKLIDNELTAGHYKITFDGNKYSSGVYFYSLISKNYLETKKMILFK